MTLTDASITDAQIIDMCGRVSEALKPKGTSWTVFFETAEITGAPSYTHRIGVSYCDTAEIAVREAVKHLPRFFDAEQMRIRMATAIRNDDLTDFDGCRIALTPQFEVKW